MHSKNWDSFWATNRGSEKKIITDLLETLSIPASSQSMVFSTTSLQLSKISPQNPRAIYFNENLYIGYIPGGHLEVIGIDPHLGPVPYIFKPPTRIQPPEITRSLRCMRCHAGPDQGGVPSLLLGSVIPTIGGGTYDKLNYSFPGHFVPYQNRFGGWYFSNISSSDHNSWENTLVSIDEGKVNKIKIPNVWSFGDTRYPVNESDQIAHLVLEHQVGFTNICTSIIYKYRELNISGSNQTTEFDAFINDSAQKVFNYLTFVEEPEIPSHFQKINTNFREEFEKAGFISNEGLSLRKMDLKQKLFKRNCSYMIFSNSFGGLPKLVQKKVLNLLRHNIKDLLHSSVGYHRILAEQTESILSQAFEEY